MRACVYYEPLYESGEDPAILAAWERSWRHFGWDCCVLSREDAQQHAMYDSVCQHTATYPTVNCESYEQACYRRWLAFAGNAPAVFTDYDVINFGLRPEQVVWTPPITPLHRGMAVVPVAMDAEGVRFAIAGILGWDGTCVRTPRGKHISDMHLVTGVYGQLHVPCLDFTADYMADGYRTAPLVHFAGRYCKHRRMEAIRNEQIARLPGWLCDPC